MYELFELVAARLEILELVEARTGWRQKNDRVFIAGVRCVMHSFGNSALECATIHVRHVVPELTGKLLLRLTDQVSFRDMAIERANICETVRLGHTAANPVDFRVAFKRLNSRLTIRRF